MRTWYSSLSSFTTGKETGQAQRLLFCLGRKGNGKEIGDTAPFLPFLSSGKRKKFLQGRAKPPILFTARGAEEKCFASFMPLLFALRTGNRKEVHIRKENKKGYRTAGPAGRLSLRSGTMLCGIHAPAHCGLYRGSEASLPAAGRTVSLRRISFRKNFSGNSIS